ncbi:MAG: dethiobiotin synthase, partial [Verrucomicrobia bacterium]|nr:dethiobiotin synthase [Verrucomicrobiota bacterium]
LRAHGVRVRASKPVSAGGREDAEALRAALGSTMTLDEINPWHFRAPLAPLLAARCEGKCVRLNEVVAHLKRLRSDCDALVIEGAGGLLSPLGKNFNASDLIASLRATPLVVCPNRLGAVGQTLLVLAALPAFAAQPARVVLVAPQRRDASFRSNAALLAEFVSRERVFTLPWLPAVVRRGLGPLPFTGRRTLDRFARL